MSRFYGRDIRSAIKTHAENATYGINAILSTIDTERGETIASEAHFKRISLGPFNGQLPELIIEVKGSEKTANGGLRSSIDTVEDTYTLNIMAYARSINDNYPKILDNYEEAIKRCFAYANISGIAYIDYINCLNDSDVTGKDYNIKIIAQFNIKIM